MRVVEASGVLIVFVFGVGGLAEDRRSDAHAVGSALDRDLVVAGHPHREDVETALAETESLDVLKELAGEVEERAKFVLLLDDGCHGHQPARSEEAHAVDLLADMGRGGGGDAGLRAFAGEIDLKEAVDLGLATQGGGLDLLREAHGVDGMDEACVREEFFHLVALEAPDHVPADVVEWAGRGVVGETLSASGPFGDHGGALGELGGAALAEVAVPEFDQLADVVHLGVLADGDDQDVFGAASASLGGRGDAVHHQLVAFAKRFRLCLRGVLHPWDPP